VSLQPEVPTNDGWQEIFHQSISHHCGWPSMQLSLPPPVNPNVQISRVVSPFQSSRASKRLKTDIPQPVQDKGKAATSPYSPSIDSSKSVSSRLHLKDDFSHVISEIHPQGSNQPRATSEKSKGNNSEKTKITSQSGKYGF
jgi:hypothetical protein